MSYLREAGPRDDIQAFSVYREYFGFVPRIIRAQALLPQVIEAKTGLARAIMFDQRRCLPQVQRERMLLAVALKARNAYCAAMGRQMLLLLGASESLDVPPQEGALLDFVVKLGTRGPEISKEDVAHLSGLGLTDDSILEAILIAGWGSYLHTLAIGAGVEPDFAPLPMADPITEQSATFPERENWGPYLRTEEVPRDFAPFAFLRDNFGFVANIFSAQTVCLDAVAAETEAIRLILLTDDVLRRIQKERVLLAVSGANQNTYWVAVYAQILSLLGVAPEESYQIAADHREVDLPEPDHALLDFAIKLASTPDQFSGEDLQSLRGHGFSEQQILEAVAVTALTRFLNTVQQGVGAPPDFTPLRSFRQITVKKANLSPPDSRLTPTEEPIDPDADLVGQAQRGDLQAFEMLIERHSKRVYRTLVGMLGNQEEARDAMQDTFLKAFQHLTTFQGRSKFSTWLVSIASNTGLQRIRDRKPMESLDDEGPEGDEGFRPRQVRSWTEDPEELYSQAEVRSLVESCVMKLPAKYRVVVLLRDFEQLSAEDAAAALGLGVPALKSRLLRGRLMLREALAPYFAKNPEGVSA